MYKQLDQQSFFLFCIALHASKNNNQEQIDGIYEIVKESSNIVDILEKRITVFNLPVINKSGIIAISLLGDYNPGKCILCLIEVLEKAKELGRQKINIDFISTIFPDGFYKDEIAFENFDKRKIEKGLYNHIIGLT